MKQTASQHSQALERLARVLWPAPDGVVVESAELTANGDFWVAYQLRHLLEAHIAKKREEEKALLARVAEIHAELEQIETVLAPCPCL